MGTIRHENLVALRISYDALEKHSKASLRAAYDFGQIVDALSHLYTYETMADELNRKKGTPALYARLYRRYNKVEELLAASDELDTFSVSVLAGHAASFRYRLTHECGVCHSTDIIVVRERVEQASVRQLRSVS